MPEPDDGASTGRDLVEDPGHIGAVAFSRRGDPVAGEFGDAKVLRTFGAVPEDLSEL